MADFSFIDLFAGIGGFRLALESVGGRCLGFSEIAPDAIHTYCANFNESEDGNFGDITKIKDLPRHDFMTAGVPCQSWSIAGKNLGFDDDRGQLWNDTLYLLNKVRPKAFIFENVKGLSDPRNQKALDYILSRIKQAGYYAQKFVLNAYDYGVPQTRVRIYIIGFREEKFLKSLQLPKPFPGEVRLNDVLDSEIDMVCEDGADTRPRWSLSCNEKGFNDYFLFNDLRNGPTTIHSWDIIDTTDREKHICYLLLRNRRKSDYGALDGNPLSLQHFQELDATINREELDTLVRKHILKPVEYLYEIEHADEADEANEQFILSLGKYNLLNVDNLKVNREVKKRKIDVHEVLAELSRRGVIRCVETRYDFKNTKISTGLAGINRIFLPSSKIYPTLVASDTNDFVATEPIDADTIEEFREEFMEHVYRPRNYRRITQSEACRIQGFPDNYILPPTRPRWMKLIGNSVAVPVIKILANAVVGTGVFDEKDDVDAVIEEKPVVVRHKQLDFFATLRQYPENIVENTVPEPPQQQPQKQEPDVEMDKNVLISLVKNDNVERYLDQSAKIYYTGKKFPSSVALNKLYYFMPYIKKKGIRDLYLIKIARVGTRKEGQPDNDPNDFRLVFEIDFVKKLFKDYKPVELEIWHTFTDTTIMNVMKR
jgi:DNA (cytosine-5)-methyltransferase 1